MLVDDDTIYVGISNRTTHEAATELARYVEVTP